MWTSRESSSRLLLLLLLLLAPLLLLPLQALNPDSDPDFDEEAELSILLCNDPYIQELNGQWRNKSAPTDVLSFPQA